jgi:hypothetical protein
MKWIHEFKPIRTYIIIITILFAGYLWTYINGIKITGDDNETKNERTHTSGGIFYHK